MHNNMFTVRINTSYSNNIIVEPLHRSILNRALNPTYVMPVIAFA